MGTTVASPLVLLARIGRHLSESYSYESNEGGAEPEKAPRLAAKRGTRAWDTERGMRTWDAEKHTFERDISDPRNT
jgi:hypothetical protein